jgi:WD40 repeat protein
VTNYFVLLAGAINILSGGCLLPERTAVKPVRVIDASCEAAAAIGLSPDGTQVFCFDYWKVHRIDLKTGKVFPLPRELRGEKIYRGVHVQKDVWLIAMSRPLFLTKKDGYKTRYVLFDFATETIKAEWAAHKGHAAALAVVPKQNELVTAGDTSDDNTVCFWDWKSLKKIGEMELVKELSLKIREMNSWIEMEQMAVDPSGSFLAFGFFQGSVHVRDLEKKTWHLVQPEHKGEYDYKGAFGGHCFLGRDRLVVRWKHYLAEEDVLEVYDWRAGKVLFRVGRKSRLTEPAASPDGRLLAFGDENDGSVRLWDVQAKRELAAFKAYPPSRSRNGGMRKMIFTPDGKQLVTSGRNGQIKVWSVEDILKLSKP